jgi:hypothetical protein
MFLVPILLVAGISISHVVAWYDLANPVSWAIYLSIAIEVGAITALVAATNKVKGGIWFMFGLVTFIQLVGNIYYSYKEIDPNGEGFKAWVELTGPIWEMIGTEQTDIVGLKRYLAYLEGGFLPLISLASLHFFVRYEKSDTTEDDDNGDTDGDNPKDDPPQKSVAQEVWDRVGQLRDEGKLPVVIEEDKEDEPTALANSEYREEDKEEIIGVIPPEVHSMDTELFDVYPIPEFIETKEEPLNLTESSRKV